MKQTPGELSGPLGPVKKEFCDEQEVVRAAQPPWTTLHLSKPPAVSLSLGVKLFRQAEPLLVFFPFFSAPLQSVLDIQEISMRQMKPDAVEVDIVSAQKLAEEDLTLAARYLKSITSDEIEFEMRQVEAIDWSHNPKRLPFVCHLP